MVGFRLFAPPFDHGLLLSIYGLQRRALLYQIGNPYTASKMTKYRLQSAIDGPVKVLLIEYEDGRVGFEWHRPSSTWTRWSDPDVDVVARAADQKFINYLGAAAGWTPDP